MSECETLTPAVVSRAHKVAGDISKNNPDKKHEKVLTHTSKRVPSLAWLLLTEIDSSKKVEWDDFPNLLTISNRNTALLQEALSRIAWVNVKKASRHIDNFKGAETRQKYDEVYSGAIRNEKVLRMQLESLNPDIIITFGQPTFYAMRKMGMIGEKITWGKKSILHAIDGRRYVVVLNHPGAIRGWGYEGVYDKYISISESIRVHGLV